MKIKDLFCVSMLFFSSAAFSANELTMSCRYPGSSDEMLSERFNPEQLKEIEIADMQSVIGFPEVILELVHSTLFHVTLTPVVTYAFYVSSVDARSIYFDGRVTVSIHEYGFPVKILPAAATINIYRRDLVTGLSQSSSILMKVSLRIDEGGHSRTGAIIGDMDSSYCNLAQRLQAIH